MTTTRTILELLDYLLLFGASFAVVFLLGVQSRNVNQGRYLAAVMTSFGISVANFTFVKYAATGTLAAFIPAAAGGCLGIACAIWFSKHVIERRRGAEPQINVTGNIAGLKPEDLDTLAKEAVHAPR